MRIRAIDQQEFFFLAFFSVIVRQDKHPISSNTTDGE